MSKTKEEKNQAYINKIKELNKNKNTIDHFNLPLAQYQAFTCLGDIKNKKDKRIKSLSYDKIQIKKILRRKIVTKDDFSQTHMMSFFPQSDKSILNITQKQFEEKMNYYKRVIKNPLNPYSTYYNKRFLMPQIYQIRYNNKAFSVLMPNLQDKTLVSPLY